MVYVPYIPKAVPRGKLLVHNHVEALSNDHPPGLNGFRCWLQMPDELPVELCQCGWAPHLEHYRVRRDGPVMAKKK
jgi:hypothetical protein